MIGNIGYVSTPQNHHPQPPNSFIGRARTFQPDLSGLSLAQHDQCNGMVIDPEPQGSPVADDDDAEMKESDSTSTQSPSVLPKSGNVTDDDTASVQYDDGNHGMSKTNTTLAMQSASPFNMTGFKATGVGMDQRNAKFVKGMHFGSGQYNQYPPDFLQSNGSQTNMGRKRDSDDTSAVSANNNTMSGPSKSVRMSPHPRLHLDAALDPKESKSAAPGPRNSSQ
jgi:hypothetical protein